MFVNLASDFMPLPVGGSVEHDFGPVPPASAAVIVDALVETDLDDGANEAVDLFLNGVLVGRIFQGSEPSCKAVLDFVQVPPEQFNELTAQGSAVVEAVRVDEDGVEQCEVSRGWVGLAYISGPASEDSNNNQIPDECEVIGDMNCNGVVNVADIGGFVAALTDPLEYVRAFPQCDRDFADLNGDGRVSPSDIAPFVALLVQR